MLENLDIINSKENFVNSVFLYLNCVSSVLLKLDSSVSIPTVVLATVGFRKILNSIINGEIEINNLNLYYVRELDKELGEYLELIIDQNVSNTAIVEKIASITALVLALAADTNFSSSLVI